MQKSNFHQISRLQIFVNSNSSHDSAKNIFLCKFSFLHSLLQWLLGGGLLLDGTGWWSATVTDPFPLHFSVFFFFLPFLSDIMSISL